MHELLTGDLDRVALSSIVQLMEIEGHHGPVHVASGQLDFIDGRLVRARFLDLEGIDAAVEALVRARGVFRVSASSEDLEGKAVPVQSIVLESCRLMDDLQRYGSLVPERPQQALDGTVGRVLRAADGERTIAALLAHTGVPVVHAVDPLVDAIDHGRIRARSSTRLDDLRLLDVRASVEVHVAAEVVAAPEPAAPAPTGSFDDLVFEARRLVRDRRFIDAENALRTAISMRPDSRIAHQNLSRVLSLKSDTAGEPGRTSQE
ncbi:MAG: DUF4388 domain-containing protein [Alphaproteobacteria bacterium]|nr:DUF4388 domain-containing protein [Alphaproteobacteria bacterium]